MQNITILCGIFVQMRCIQVRRTFLIENDRRMLLNSDSKRKKQRYERQFKLNAMGRFLEKSAYAYHHFLFFINVCIKICVCVWFLFSFISMLLKAIKLSHPTANEIPASSVCAVLGMEDGVLYARVWK